MPLLSAQVCGEQAVSELGGLRPSVRTVEALLERDVEQLARECSCAVAARRAAAQWCAPRPVCGDDEPEEWHLTTGSRRVDDLLGGGLVGPGVCEVHGPSGSGKRALCHTVAARCGRSVLWIEAATCSFSARQIQALDDTALDRIDVVFVPNSRRLVDALWTATASVVIVDSPRAVLAPNLGGNNNPLGHKDLADVAHALARLALTSLVLTVNSTVQAGGPSTKSASYKPALGLAWTYVANLRLALDHGTATLLKHPVRAIPDPNSAPFAIHDSVAFADAPPRASR